MPERHRIHDLASPRLPLPLRAANALGRPFAGRIRLDPESLLDAARRRAGCEDFGDPGFREPLRVLLGAIEREAGLSPLGRFSTRALLTQLLANRLRVEDTVRRHPELLETPVARPIVIAGLPRTGTTHLHNLVSADPALRHLPYWESMEPVALPGDRDDPAPRIARCQQAVRLTDYAMPHFKRMHEMTPEAPHEEIQLLAIDFRTMLFEASYHVPSYRDWYKQHDQTDAYRYLYRVLQVIQHLRGPKPPRWVLKSPQHLEQLEPLMRVFPDAKVVLTHRDPVRITASMATMAAYTGRMQAARVDPRRAGRYWADRIEDLLRGSVDGRAFVPDDQLFDVRFPEFMKDDVGMVERVFAFADQPWSAETEDAIRARMDANPRGKFGAVEYRLEDLGLDAAERHEALRFYSDRFDVPPE
jgi:hypothetical protein